MPFNLSHTVAISWQTIASNKLRAMLTSLGIIFGVGSVISMLSVGKGAEKEILEQMKLLGANNVVVKPIIEQNEGAVDKDETKKAAEKKRYTPGLTLEDAYSIRDVVPGVLDVSPELITELTVIREGYKRSAKLVGVEPVYFSLSDFRLSKGEMFTPMHIEMSAPVCIIGSGIRAKFFSMEDPIGKTIKCGSVWLTVIGVLEERKISEDNIKHLGIRNYNMDVYTPITTALVKFRNRSLITKAMIAKASRSGDMFETADGKSDEESAEKKNYNQLDRITVRMAASEGISEASDIITRMLDRRHNKVVDFEVTIPEMLLRQEQRTKTIFNIVLGAIASISLLVGGIGIMNIMLASVMERTREIGVRRAVGARRRDITLQFLSEAVVLCLSGGILGIIFGIALSVLIEKFTDISTIVSIGSVMLSFSVAVAVGLLFGIVPARRAAMQNPIESLRYE